MLICPAVSLCRGEAPESDFFMLRKDSGAISINRYARGQIKEKVLYPATPQSIYATDGHTHAALFERETGMLRVYSLAGGKPVEKQLPSHLNIKTALLHKGSVFLGGEDDNATSIKQIDIDTLQREYLTIPEAPDFLRRKSIDAFLVDGDMLLAVDNIVTPKYIIYFNIGSRSRALYSHYEKLRDNGPYESIRGARISGDYIGTISFSGGQGGGFSHITVYRKDDISSSFALHGRISPPIFEIEGAKFSLNRFTDFIITGNRLVFASAEKGIGVLDILPGFFEGGGNPAEKINYLNPGDFLREGETISGLTPIPGTGKTALSITAPDGTLRHIALKI